MSPGLPSLHFNERFPILAFRTVPDATRLGCPHAPLNPLHRKAHPPSSVTYSVVFSDTCRQHDFLALARIVPIPNQGALLFSVGYLSVFYSCTYADSRSWRFIYQSASCPHLRPNRLDDFSVCLRVFHQTHCSVVLLVNTLFRLALAAQSPGNQLCVQTQSVFITTSACFRQNNPQGFKPADFLLILALRTFPILKAECLLSQSISNTYG